MGKTVLPYSWAIDGLEEKYREFRRALRKADKSHFDALFNHARFFTPSGVQQSSPDPFESLVLSVLLHQEKELAVLREKMAALEGTPLPKACPP